jgi:hypothetical protein
LGKLREFELLVELGHCVPVWNTVHLQAEVTSVKHCKLVKITLDGKLLLEFLETQVTFLRF